MNGVELCVVQKSAKNMLDVNIRSPRIAVMQFLIMYFIFAPVV